MSRYDIKKKDDAISIVQKSLKIMKDEAQQYIDKHHVNLPPICTSKHYLFLSLNGSKSQQKNKRLLIHSTSRTSIDKRSPNHDSDISTTPKPEKQVCQPTICHVQFSDNSLMNSEKTHNSYSRRMKVNEDWKKRQNSETEKVSDLNKSLTLDKSRKTLKRVQINSETLDIGEEREKRKRTYLFDPKKSRLDLEQRQEQIFKRYNIKNISKVENKSTQLTKNDKFENQATKHIDHSNTIDYEHINLNEFQSEEIQLISTRRKKKIRQKIEIKKIMITSNIGSKEKKKPKYQMKNNAKKQGRKWKNGSSDLEVNYTPWQQNQQTKQFDQILGIDKF